MINGVPRILIVRLGSIGDVVRVLPAVHSLRHAFPEGQIDWAVEPKSAGIVEGHLDLDRVLVFERGDGFWDSSKAFLRFCRKIREGHYDIVLDFHGILKSGLIVWFSRTPVRYGFARPRSREGSYLFTNRKVHLGRDTLSRVEENLRLSEQLAPRLDSAPVPCHVSEEIQAEVDDYFEATFEGGKRVVALHVPVEREEKRWPTGHFAALSDLLLADGRFDVVLTWGPGQFREVEEVLALTKREPHVAPEMADLKHYMWLVHRAHLYFGGDTGPMHIAWAMGTPVVAVFGGTDPLQHAPLGNQCEALTAEKALGAEARLKGMGGAEKLRLVTPEAAYDSCVRLSVAGSSEPA